LFNVSTTAGGILAGPKIPFHETNLKSGKVLLIEGMVESGAYNLLLVKASGRIFPA
jgi:hypothetical protein